MLHYFPTPHILGKRGRPHHQRVPFMRALKENNTAKIRIKRVKTPRHLDDQKSKDRLPMQISWIQGQLCVCFSKNALHVCTTYIALFFRAAGRYIFRTELDIHNLISEKQQQKRQLTTGRSLHSSDLRSCPRK